MSVADQQTYFSYAGNGATTLFPYLCKVLDDEDLKVFVDGVQKALGVDYSIAGVGQAAGGNVLFAVGSTPANGTLVEIYRELPVERVGDYLTAGDFQAVVVNEEQDRIVMLLQQLLANQKRCLKLPRSVITDQVLTGSRAAKLVAFDINGNLYLADSSSTVTVQQGVAGSVAVTYADAASGPVNVNLPASGEVIIIKTDATDNPVTITATGGKTVCREATVDLTLQDESIRLVMQGTNWYSIH